MQSYTQNNTCFQEFYLLWQWALDIIKVYTNFVKTTYFADLSTVRHKIRLVYKDFSIFDSELWIL